MNVNTNRVISKVKQQFLGEFNVVLGTFQQNLVTVGCRAREVTCHYGHVNRFYYLLTYPPHA